jgi:phosphonate transport system substrate-binding protein
LENALKTSRRSFLLLLLLSGCGAGSRSISTEQLVIGTVGYGKGADLLSRYDRFNRYLEEKMRVMVQLEPAYNESKALERIRANAWSLVFAPPGLAALAISRHQYTPMFPLEGVSNLRSVIVVKQDSPYQTVKSLAGKPFAIGQIGSTTGYYFPIYNLYGITLSELVLCPTPKAVLEAIATNKAEAGALSLEELNSLRSQVSDTSFRVLFTDQHRVPSGVVLLSPTIDLNLQESLRRVIADTPSQIASEVGLVPTGTLPDYKYMISVVERVNSIFPAEQLKDGTSLLTQKPVRLFQGNAASPQ